MQINKCELHLNKMTPFYDKNSEQLDIEEMYVNIIKTVHDKFTAYITFNGLK